MDEDCLKLSAYFGERQRSGDRFLADVMLGLYEQRRLATSIVMRGIAGFGPRHHLRSDQSLSLSEDPPIAVIAVDTRTTVERLVDPLLAIKERGLLTLERARLLSADIGPVELPEELHEATKLTIYVGRKERVNSVPVHIAVCELMYRRQLAGASVFLGVDGTIRGDRKRAGFFDRNTNVPMMIIAVGKGELIGRVLPELGGLLGRPLLTLERVRVCKRDGLLLARPHDVPSADEQGIPLWQKLMVYTSESAQHDGVPIHRALIRRLRQRESSHGATVLRGIWGFHGGQQPHGDRLLSLGRQVPVVTIIIDTPDNIAEFFDVVDELTQEHGLVTSEVVPALVASGDGDGPGAMRMAHHRY